MGFSPVVIPVNHGLRFLLQYLGCFPGWNLGFSPLFLVAQRKREVVTVMERLTGLSAGSHSWTRAWRP